MATPGHPSAPGERRTSWSSLDEVLQGSHELPRWIGWRLRALVSTMLLVCALFFLLAHWLSAQPHLPFALRVTPEGLIKIHAVDYTTLVHLEGRVLDGVQLDQPVQSGMQTLVAPIELLSLQRSARWIIEPSQRQRHLQLHQRMDTLLRAAAERNMMVKLDLAHAQSEAVQITPIGWAGLSPLFWLLGLLSIAVFGVGAVVLLAGPQWRNMAFAALALSQSGQLMFIAIENNLDVLAPTWLVQLDLQMRLVFDLVGTAALVQVAVLHPHRMAGWGWYTALAWLSAAGLWLGLNQLDTSLQWWAMQLGCIGLSVAAVSLMTASLQQTPHPFTLMMRRLLVVALLTWLLLSLAVWRGDTRADMHLNITHFGVLTWQVFAAMAVLLSPYLSRSRPILQEFSLLAASSTIAASLDLLFVAVFSLSQFTSMTLSLFFSFGLYLIIRRWVMARLPGRDSLTMERLFQRLYRIAREVERQPETLDASLIRLMRELYDPLEITLVQGDVGHTSLRGNGSVLLVQIPARSARPMAARHVLVLKHSHKGQRLFTSEDARLAERVMEQLNRALNFDQAVEQGRSEERLRIAQDLHDDIGARLLTLMYQAPNAESEEYIRHTIQDLKTLTRGLAAQSHLLSEAAGEWKRDLSQRLAAARCELDWNMFQDTDLTLTMVQWSALTRIMRELVSNAISHAKAKRVQVNLRLESDCLTLSVEDDGVGREPATWSHGLGLGGVRKRVKQLGGSVHWMEAEPKGIRCEVVVDYFSGSSGMTGTGAQPGGTPPAPDSQFSH